jgi:MFS family permease
MEPEEESLTIEARLQMMLRSLRYRNYRLFFIGQGLSVIGTWMQNIAMSWLIFSLTGQPAFLGIVPFVSQLPVILISPFAGVLADRHNRRRILIATQSLALCQALALAALAWSGTVQIWHIIALGGCLGLVNAFDVPTRQSFVVNMVENKADIPNAIALNSMLFNSARFIGPALAGMLLAAAEKLVHKGEGSQYGGEAVCFLINAISYLAVIIALVKMKVPEIVKSGVQKNIREDLMIGARYVFGSPPIRAILLQLMVMSLLGMSYATLMPAFAKVVLHGGADTQGFLMSAAGAGAICGAIYLASRRSTEGLEKIIAFAGCIFSLGLMAFSHSTILAVSIAIMMVNGLAGA